MLPFHPIYVWKYGLGTEVIVTTVQDLLKMPLAQHPQQPHHLEMALTQQHQKQDGALAQKYHP